MKLVITNVMDKNLHYVSSAKPNSFHVLTLSHSYRVSSVTLRVFKNRRVQMQLVRIGPQPRAYFLRVQ